MESSARLFIGGGGKWKERGKSVRTRGWKRKVTHVPHPRHAPSGEVHARFTRAVTDVPALIRHRTTRVTAPLYTASRCALHIHTQCVLDAPLRHSPKVWEDGRA